MHARTTPVTLNPMAAVLPPSLPEKAVDVPCDDEMAVVTPMMTVAFVWFVALVWTVLVLAVVSVVVASVVVKVVMVLVLVAVVVVVVVVVVVFTVVVFVVVVVVVVVPVVVVVFVVVVVPVVVVVCVMVEVTVTVVVVVVVVIVVAVVLNGSYCAVAHATCVDVTRCIVFFASGYSEWAGLQRQRLSTRRWLSGHDRGFPDCKLDTKIKTVTTVTQASHPDGNEGVNDTCFPHSSSVEQHKVKRR